MLINKDLTKEVITLYVTENQIYGRIFCKFHGKWKVEEYFKDFNFEVDEELVHSTIRLIKSSFGLKNPMIITN